MSYREATHRTSSERKNLISGRYLPIFLLFLLPIIGQSCKGTKNEPQNIEATSLILNETGLELIEGEQVKLSLTVVPAKATLTYMSDNPEIAFIDSNGLVSAVKQGKTKIRVSSGKLSKECTITVQRADNSKTFSTLPLPPIILFSKSQTEIDQWEAKNGGTFEPKLSGEEPGTGVEMYAFNVAGDPHVKLRIYRMEKNKSGDLLVSETSLFATPVEYVFDLNGGKARLNSAFRKLMSQSGFVLSGISPMGASYVNPTARIGVIIGPTKHPNIGLMAQFNYKIIG